MARPTTRTDPLDHVLYTQLLEFCEEDHRSMKSFYLKFVRDELSYETFQAAMRGELVSDETAAIVETALNEAQRSTLSQYRRCPHCNTPLD